MNKKIKSSHVFRIDVPPEGEFDDYRQMPKISHTETKYDESGNVLEDIKYDDFGEMTGKVVYQYDEQGRLILEETYSETDELEEKLTFERDNDGKVIREYIHYLDNTTDTIEYHYNPDGKLIRKTLTD
nr:hypothetical protein [Bacteroidota bacterium]